ncbi:MAG: hypothetical protein GY724_20170 [Actinomycetia bacterium]|nr:hypothetical protein [Actinomycetes bacterium]MCP5033767.1 hypothetical protein [Actinomycetes bacterium]
MKQIPRGYILPSAAFPIQTSLAHSYVSFDTGPEPGDVVYGRIAALGHHRELENKSGRIHRLTDSTRSLFVYGNRYATDAFEALVPDEPVDYADLVARSGVIGRVRVRNSRVLAPTTVRVLGRVVDKAGRPLSTRDHSLVAPQAKVKRSPRSKLILVVGTAMNSGKSTAAVAICWALTAMGHKVRASKVTGTASLKEILHMNDAGASVYNDFTYLGYPSTYMLERSEVLGIFNDLDLKFANNPRNFWVVEVADGILQRETAMLLSSPEVTDRLHRLVFCASDVFGAIGGLHVLSDTYGLHPDAISGIVASSPLGIRELTSYVTIPAFDSAEPDLRALSEILLAQSR